MNPLEPKANKDMKFLLEELNHDKNGKQKTTVTRSTRSKLQELKILQMPRFVVGFIPNDKPHINRFEGIKRVTYDAKLYDESSYKL